MGRRTHRVRHDPGGAGARALSFSTRDLGSVRCARFSRQGSPAIGKRSSRSLFNDSATAVSDGWPERRTPAVHARGGAEGPAAAYEQLGIARPPAPDRATPMGPRRHPYAAAFNAAGSPGLAGWHPTSLRGRTVDSIRARQESYAQTDLRRRGSRNEVSLPMSWASSSWAIYLA